MFLTSLGLIAPAATLTTAVFAAALGSGNSTRRKLETGPNAVNCKARISVLLPVLRWFRQGLRRWKPARHGAIRGVPGWAGHPAIRRDIADRHRHHERRAEDQRRRRRR